MSTRFPISPQGEAEAALRFARRRRGYTLILLACIISAILFSLTVRPIYVAKTLLKIEPALSIDLVIDQITSQPIMAGNVPKNLTAVKAGEGVIAVSVAAEDPKFVRQFLDTVMRIYIQKSLERKLRERNAFLENLREKNAEIEAQLKAAKEALDNFEKQQDVASFSQDSVDIIRVVTGLQSKLSQLESQKASPEQITNYKKQLAAIAPEIAKLSQSEQNLLQLTQDVVIKRQWFLDSSTEITKLTRKVIKSEIQILRPATLQRKINWIKILLINLLGLAGGIFLCLTIFVSRNRTLFRVIRYPRILERIAKLPVVASIPHSQVNIGLLSPKDRAAIALQDLAARIKIIMRDAKNNVLLLTSDGSDQGKSFVAANFSLFAAENQRTLLIDGDLTKGMLHLNFATLKLPGFSDLIAGKATLDQVLANPIDEKLWFIPAGKETLDYSLLQNAEKFKSLMHIFSECFDLVVIDFPVADDPEILAAAGAIFVVVRQGEKATRAKQFFDKYPAKLKEISSILLNDVVS